MLGHKPLVWLPLMKLKSTVKCCLQYFRWGFLLLPLLLIAGCDSSSDRHEANAGLIDDEAARYQTTLVVFGTLVEITIYGVTTETAAASVRRIEARYRQMHRDWHPWQAGLMYDINQAFASSQCITVDAETRALIELAIQISKRSEGRFNPAIGKLIAVWGFHTDEPEAGRPPPKAAVIKDLVKANPQLSDVHIRNQLVCSDNPAVSLDLSGIAKGWAVDVAIRYLKEDSISNAIVNAGGDLRVIGRAGQGAKSRSWRVGVRHPVTGGVLAEIDASGDEAIFTSGNYERFNEYEGVRYTHIIAPNTGWPVHDINSATVITATGAEADAWATGLVVAGSEGARELAQREGLKQVLLVNEAGEVWVSRDLYPRLQLNVDAQQVHVFDVQ